MRNHTWKEVDGRSCGPKLVKVHAFGVHSIAALSKPRGQLQHTAAARCPGARPTYGLLLPAPSILPAYPAALQKLTSRKEELKESLPRGTEPMPPR